MDHNFYNIDYSTLPSKGCFYPWNSKIKFRPFTFAEVKSLASINEGNASETLNSCLQKVIKTEGDLKFEDILYMDRSILILNVRNNTFLGSSKGFTVDHKCPYCNKTTIKAFGAQDLICRSIGEGPEVDSDELKLEEHGLTIYRSLRKINDILHATDDLDNDYILNYTNLEEALYQKDPNIVTMDFLSEISAVEYSKLLHFAKAAEYGVMNRIEIKCDNCQKSVERNILLSDYTLFKGIDIYQMLKNKVNIAKYSAIIIDDDMLYPEYSMILHIVDNMMKEEMDAINKSSRSNSSSSTSLSVPSLSSLSKIGGRHRYF